MATSSASLYCPLIQRMVNSGEPSNSTGKISALAVSMVSLHGFISCFGILENLLILGVVGFHVRRSVISIWILNLAASDLLATASLPFFTLFMARGHTWTLGTTFCRLHSSMFFLNMFVSGFLLAAISLDRCLVVLRPVLAQNHRSIRLVGKVCALIWALALLCTIPFYVFRDTVQKQNGKVICYYNYAQHLPSGHFDLASVCRSRQQTMGFMKLFLAFLIPLVVIITSYAAVTARLASRGCRRSFRFVRLVVAVVMSFVLCWAPYHLFSTMEVLAHDGSSLERFVGRALPIAASITFLNSVLNPVLYVFSCPDLCSKIRHSFGAVMETVLAEDLLDFGRRRNTAHSINGSSEVGMRGRPSLPTISLRAEDAEEQ
ncbi:prostaglandin D2 receptor 2 [Myripristis murdjan]|uniref:Prostaglandin D2 receptor 2 n=1 Tax=Myripristis murdjan TaxID=586833 RepID=A0A667Z7C8_9TELE|nr:prostaglandin D2 receptor 2 [Myripristis murdjan]